CARDPRYPPPQRSHYDSSPLGLDSW
nr:immunoglobulin heavy chain junction region [Macaca mulatta]MOW77378.1 immunoglobulin heavy chain junction region [Macaca mulatta]MOW80186.1 immunoglobulin heavy chain junction region [Macaca mulatta]MOW83835.1 immunoglobulin heavy chain junction region [Macaca mulatta]MOW85728.1 immunoglobulin heavy chain junction region [Macaca mulatta]